MIIQGSRYYQAYSTVGGVSVPIAVKREPFVARKTVTIVTNYGDTFEKIAARVLRDSTQYWKIAGLNPHVTFPDIIPVGTTIIVPVV